MLDGTEHETAVGHEVLAKKDNPPLLATAKKMIGLEAGAISIVLTIATLAQAFTRSRSTVIGLIIAGCACLVLIAIVGAALHKYWNREIKVQMWVPISAIGSYAIIGIIFLAWLSSSHPGQPRASGTPKPSPSSTRATPLPLPLTRAVAEMNSDQMATRLGGIFELQKLMRTYPGDQPTAINAICAFLVKNSPAKSSGANPTVGQDIQAVLNVLAHRNPANDGGAEIRLYDTNLTGANLSGADLANASITGGDTDLTDANLTNVNLRGAQLANSYFGGANLTGTDFTDANLTSASFYQTRLCSSNEKPIYSSEGYNCTG